MKYIIIIILFVALITLTGCGVFNLGGFVMPDDLEFIAIIQSLDTAKKIGTYMDENFTYKANLFSAVSPYKLWKTGLGDCNDFACFGRLCGDYNDIPVYEIVIRDGSLYLHHVCVYEEYLWNKKYSFTDNTKYYSGYNTFREVVFRSAGNVGIEWTSYTVRDYNGNIVEKGIK